MAQCPVEGCTVQVRFLHKRVAQHAADANLLVDMLERLGKLLNGQVPGSSVDQIPGLSGFTLYQCGTRGADFVTRMHGAAHGENHVVPSLRELNEWRDQAAAMTLLLAEHDSDWYAEFWSQKFASGMKPPRGQIADELRRRGVV